MADIFSTFQSGIDDPAEHALSVTPNDTTDLAISCRMIYVGGAGDLKVTTVGGESVTFKAVPVGTTLRVRANRIFSTGTTATLLLALW